MATACWWPWRHCWWAAFCLTVYVRGFPMRSDSDIAIEVSGLSKLYPAKQKPLRQITNLLLKRQDRSANAFQALKPMSFQLYRGETLGIIGRNGAGKSTLLQLICGTLQPTTGSVRIHGKIAALLELG